MNFVVPLKMNSQWSSNTIYAGVHWTQRKKQADQVHEMVGWLVKGKEQYLTPVEITMYFNCGLDIDNCAYVAKLIIDGLRHSGILIDDTKKYVKALSLRYWEGEGVKVEIKKE